MYTNYLRLNKHVAPHSKPEVIQDNDNDFNLLV